MKKSLTILAIAAIAAIHAFAADALRTRTAAPADVGITQTTFALGDEITVSPFDDVSFALKIADALPGFAGRKAFAAHLGDGVRVATIIAGDDGYDIEIRDIASARLYRISCRNGCCSLEELDLSSTQRGNCIEEDAPIRGDEEESDESAASTQSKLLLSASGNPFDDNEVAPAPVTVDIMLVFDSGAKAWVEKQSSYANSITNFAIAQVAKMNTVLANTGLHTNFWYRLVDVVAVDGKYTSVDMLGTIKAGAESGDGVFGPIKEHRAACGADLVSVIIDTGSAYGTTGIGYVTHGTSYSTWLAYKAWCYSCCAVRSVDLEYTLSHEVGHNMGLTHSPTLKSWSKVATFDYSNGYNFWGTNGVPYHTVMAYDTDVNYSGYYEVPYFSTPDYEYMGVPLGTAISNDCTRALRQTCLGIADWHATTIPLPSEIAFSPSSTNAYRITLSNTGGYEMRFTTDGTTPTHESTLYTGPITLTSGSITINAIAVVDDETVGAVYSATYSAAVELDEYAKLEYLYSGNKWSEADWCDQDSTVFYSTYWNSSSDKTALIDLGGSIYVDRAISLATLVADGTEPLEIVATNYTLTATNLYAFGDTVLSGTGFSFDNWNLHTDSTLVLSPGEGNDVTLSKYLSLGEAGSTLAITNGTLCITKSANSGDGISTLQQSAVRIDDGGTLSLDAGWVAGYANTNSITVNKGGLLRINALESTRRPLVLNGGDVAINYNAVRAYEMRAMTITVTDDSTISDTTANGVARVYIMEGDANFDVLEGATLTFDATIATSTSSGTWYQGIVKTGDGEVEFLREILHTGTNTVKAGTWTIGYSSTTATCPLWSVAKGATLKINTGCSLAVNDLELSRGAILSLPASDTAPLTSTGGVDLAGVVLKLHNATNFSYGTNYPLIAATGGVTGQARADKSAMPSLAAGLAWKFKVTDNTLYANVVSEAEALEPVVLVSNNSDLVLEVPDDAVKTSTDVTIVSSPLVVDGLSNTAIAVTLDVEIPDDEASSEQTLCSWTLGSNVIRCVRDADGYIDCFYASSSHADNVTNSVQLSSGRHTIKIGYRSNGDYYGTWVFADNEPAYYASDLRWSAESVGKVTIGATAFDTPTLVYSNLVVHGVSIIEPTSTEPLPCMTSSGGDITYNYLATKSLPRVFGNTPAGGFQLDESLLCASLSESYSNLSISVVAAFPNDAEGTLMGFLTKGTTFSYSVQAEHLADGSFAIRDNGYSLNSNPATVINEPATNVASPHLYTMTYTIDEGVRFYQDGVQILEATGRFLNNGYLAYYNVTFGCGYWTKWLTSYNDYPMPMPDFTVYASHIELGSDDHSVSEDAVMESLNFDSAYDGMDIAEKLAYLPDYQTATGVAAADELLWWKAPEAPDEPNTVDVLFLVDQKAQAYAAANGFTVQEKVADEFAFINTNVFPNTGIDDFMQWRAVGFVDMDLQVTSVNDGYYALTRKDVSSQVESGSDPVGLYAVPALRDHYGADIVVLYTRLNGSDNLGDSGTTDLGGISCIHLQNDSSYDGDYTVIAHELAHTFGCSHSDGLKAMREKRAEEQANGNTNDYHYAYNFTTDDGEHYVTLVGTGYPTQDDDGNTVLGQTESLKAPFYSSSNPNYTYMGHAVGTPTNDNTRILIENAEWMSQYSTPRSERTGTDAIVFSPAANVSYSKSEGLSVTLSATNEEAQIWYRIGQGADQSWANSDLYYRDVYNEDYETKEPSLYVEPLGLTNTYCMIAAYTVLNGVTSDVQTVKYIDNGQTRTTDAILGSPGLVWLNDTESGKRWTEDASTLYNGLSTMKCYPNVSWESGAMRFSELSTTVVGPTNLTFRYKADFTNSFFFAYLGETMPVFLTGTTNTEDWIEVAVEVPEGEQELSFQYGKLIQNGSCTGVWLAGVELGEIAESTPAECAHTSTSENVTWTFPTDGIAVTNGYITGVEIDSTGVVSTLDFGSTNAVAASVLAELPEGVKGTIACVKVYRSSSGATFYAFAYSNGDGTFSLGFDTTTNKVTSSAISGWTEPHVWTLVFAAQTGTTLYCDGEEILTTTSIKWSNSAVSGSVVFGDDVRGGWALAGMKMYSLFTDFGADGTIFDSAAANGVDGVLGQFSALDDYKDDTIANRLAMFNVINETGSAEKVVATSCVLRVSEIMPKPTDAQNPGDLEGMDVNGLESGWVELENTSASEWADLADYKFIRGNRSKATSKGDYGSFPSVLIAPKARYVFYTSERYSNSADMTVSAWAEADEDGAAPKLYGDDLHNVLVWPDKVNPKKSPFVRLYYGSTIVDTIVVPSDVPEGCSIIVSDTVSGEATKRWLCTTPTRGTANTDTTSLTPLGPNAGPLYEIAKGKKHSSENEFARTAPPAKPGEDYEITFSFNPVMHPTKVASFRDEDAITNIVLDYRTDITNDVRSVSVDFSTLTNDTSDWGNTYTVAIPADDLPDQGHLVQWRFRATDASGNTWTSPSFNNPDDGYEWYGTIVEPTDDQMSANLPTWHLFASGDNLTQMDVDADDQTIANNARIAIYDSSTSNYYDYVRIDLRGHTSANFTKKGHGLRFAKAHPLNMTDIVTGEEIKKIRKTSLISEYADPSYMRQMIAFWLFRKMGNLVPFDFPVRCNLNGEFYQLAFNSERFTDELIEDVYGLDKFGYSYKNVGTMKSGGSTSAGSIEKKTPDDEDESNITVLESDLRSKITAAQNVSGTTSDALSSETTDSTGLDNASLTKFVVQKYNLPAWINYLASARITQEMDDVWANVCVYYDNAEMTDGVRGTDTWMPLGYDFNLSFGQWYYNDIGGTRSGLMATNDWFKSHPFYGGNRVRCWKSSAMANNVNYGNDGFESVWQSAKFRRLYLRRLRTLMDQELKEPGTDESEVPFMVKMREMAELMQADAALDTAKWPNDSTDNAIDVWGDSRPTSMNAGIDDIWDNYVVPRRQHLYVTHSVTNTAWAVGYGSNLNAGIPEAQSDISVLAPNISLDLSQISDGVAIISNANAEVVDMSGWTLSYGVDWTLPAGTVCDSNDCIIVVADRRAYIAANADTLTDQVILGNAEFVESAAATVVNAADGTCLTLSGSLATDASSSTITFTAESVEAANALAASVTPSLTDDDVEAGLETQYLTVVAEPTDTDGTYTLAVAVNPATVAAPETIDSDDTSEEEPVSFDDETDGKTVTVTLKNAVKGLWYGYEVSDALGDAEAFENDADSFSRATDAKFKMSASSPRDSSKTAGFFRVKVLPAKPAN